jgi:hypothetical protein
MACPRQNLRRKLEMKKAGAWLRRLSKEMVLMRRIERPTY